jgi:PTS system N-acetylgalactosamine-specific IIA component
MRPAAVVAGHGAFAPGIISAVEQITGLGARFVAVSNAALDAAGLEAAIREAVATSGARAIFTDLPAGSCTIAARRVARGNPQLAVVTGVNLATLLEFATKSADDATAFAACVEKGKAAMLVAQSPEPMRVD